MRKFVPTFLALSAIACVAVPCDAQRFYPRTRPTFGPPVYAPPRVTFVEQQPPAPEPAAQPAPPKPAELPGSEVDTFEVNRLGDRVVVSGEGPRSADDVLFAMAMQPPADDSDRWQLTVFGPSTDAATLALVKAFELDPNLAPFVAAPPKGTPWAHFQFFQTDNTMQRARFAEWGIDASTSLPIVTVQPPRNGNFGGIQDGRAIVVDRIDARNMQPEQLRRRITASVMLYCKKLAESGFVPPQKLVRRMYGDDDVQLARSDSHGQFPWGPQQPPPATPFHPQWPQGGPAADPTPAPGGGWQIPIPSAHTLLMFLMAASNVWLLWRDIAQRAGIKLLIDEPTFQKLKEALAKLGVNL